MIICYRYKQDEIVHKKRDDSRSRSKSEAVVKSKVLFHRRCWTARQSKARTGSWDFGQVYINPLHPFDKVSELLPLLFAPLRWARGPRQPPAERLISTIHKLQPEVETVRIVPPALERPKHRNRILDSVEIHDGIREAVSRDTIDDATVKTSNLLGAREVEHRLDILVHARDVGFGGVVTKGIDVVNREPGGGLSHVGVARREEVRGRTRVTRSGDLKLVPARGFEAAILEGAVALLEDADCST